MIFAALSLLPFLVLLSALLAAFHDFSLFRHATIYNRCAWFATNERSSFTRWKPRWRSRSCNVLRIAIYRSILFSRIFTHFSLCKLKEGIKSTRKTTGKNRFWNFSNTWLDQCQVEYQRNRCEYSCWIFAIFLLDLMKFTSGINTAHRIKCLFIWN